MSSFAESPHLESPLFMAMDNPVLHQFISYLTERTKEQEKNPETHLRIELSRDLIARVRESFKQNILDGERRLHTLAHLLCSALLEGDFELHSNVIGVLPGSGDHPFLIRERISRDVLFTVTDIDLGQLMLDNFRYNRDGNWVPLQLSANFVEYLPTGRTRTGVNRLTSRVKAEEELWNKVADEIFGLDELVSRDKHLQQYSKFVKDIFGIKIVCEDDDACVSVHQKLQRLGAIGMKGSASNGLILPDDEESLSLNLLEFVETKDYLHCPADQAKKTGWRALKSVTRWHNRLFEIQVQPLANYFLELDHMSGPSHSSFKLRRDSLRDEIAKRFELYGFYRELLKMIFMETAVSFEYANASVVIT